jgi:hypothetical protein
MAMGVREGVWVFDMVYPKDGGSRSGKYSF